MRAKNDMNKPDESNANDVDVPRLVRRWDVCYSEHRCYPEPHFCREWDEDGGCYGTNPDHGMTWDEARKEVADWYQRMADEWRNKSEY